MCYTILVFLCDLTGLTSSFRKGSSSMYQKTPKGWLKHWDFILLELLCVQVSLVLAFFFRLQEWNLFINPMYRDIAVFLLIDDICVIYILETFKNNPMEFYVGATDVETGKAVYHPLNKATYDTYEWIRASASMPLASKVVELEGYKLLDGGVADSIPLEYFEEIGYTRNVVILTQPLGYRKSHNRLMPLMRVALRKYPNMIRAMEERHLMYNRQLEYVARAEQEGRCLVIRPDGKIPIGHISHDPDQMRLVYNMGRQVGERYMEKIKEYYTCE